MVIRQPIFSYKTLFFIALIINLISIVVFSRIYLSQVNLINYYNNRYLTIRDEPKYAGNGKWDLTADACKGSDVNWPYCGMICHDKTSPIYEKCKLKGKLVPLKNVQNIDSLLCPNGAYMDDNCESVTIN